MPAIRTGKRSKDTTFVMAKVPPEPEAPQMVAFSLNLTPDNFQQSVDDSLHSDAASPCLAFLPGPDSPVDWIESTVKKPSHSRKRPDDYVTRPPNPFILFRSAFVRGQNTVKSVEDDHKNLSKVCANVWRALTDDQKRPWVRKAKEEMARHKERHPTYTFRPRPKQDAKGEAGAEVVVVKVKRKMKEVRKGDGKREQVIAQLYLDGVHGEALVAAMNKFDEANAGPIQPIFETPITAKAFQRRASSAPLPDDSTPFLEKRSSPKARKPRASSSQPTSTLPVSSSSSPAPTEESSSPSPMSPTSDYDFLWDTKESPSPSPIEKNYVFPPAALPPSLDTSYRSDSSTMAPPAITQYPSSICYQPQPQLPPAHLAVHNLSRSSSQESFDGQYSPVTPLSAQPSFDQWANNTLTMPNTPVLHQPMVSHMQPHGHGLTPCSSFESFQPMTNHQQYGYVMQPTYQMPPQVVPVQAPVQMQTQVPGPYYHQMSQMPNPMPNVDYGAEYQTQQYHQMQQVPVQQGYYHQYPTTTMDMAPQLTANMGYPGSVEPSYYAAPIQGYAS